MNDFSTNIDNFSSEKHELLKLLLKEQGIDTPETQIIPRRTETSPCQLSFAQQRLWFLDQLELGKYAYNIPAALRLRGQLNLPALEQSLNKIVQRHEALRTTFTTVDGQPVQVINPTLTLALTLVDLRELPEVEQEVEVQRLATEDAQRPFNLERGPLLRVTLLRLGEAEQVMLFTMHHIIADGWSIGILIRELATLYTAFSSGKPYIASQLLRELPIQYADFALWQRQWLQGEVLESQLNYWKQQLAETPALYLPTDRPRPVVQTFRGAAISFSLSTDLTRALEALSQREGVTLFMTLLAAFKILLYRYTSQDKILVGSPIANRNRTETEGLIGFFVNTLVLHTYLGDNPSFRELLLRVREVALGAYAHQDLPFEYLVEELQPERDLSHNPLFQVMFVLQNTPMEELKLPGLTLSSLNLDNRTAKFDLTLSMSSTELELIGSLEYNTDLFDATTITRMLAHWRTLLEGIVADPEQCLSKLPLLTETEQHQLLVEWNQTQTNYPQNQCIHEWFEAQVERRPDAVAVVFEDKQLTYRELNQQANKIAHYLRKLGVRPEIQVGICMERSVEMVVGLLGILKAGGAYVPLDPSYPNERLSYMLADSGVEVLLTKRSLLKSLPQNQAIVVCLDTDWGAIEQHTQENLDTGVCSDNLAYVIYTSGSTGKPKGVMITHQALRSFTQTALSQYEIIPSDRVLQFASINFDAAVEEIYPCLCTGATLVLRSNEMRNEMRNEMLADLRTFFQACKDLQLTVLDLPTAYWHQLVADLARADVVLPESLRLVIIGGERVLPESVRCWQQYVAKSGKSDRLQLINTYGPTETTVSATLYRIRSSNSYAAGEVPIGRPLAHLQAYILDPNLQPVPIGVPGELYIGGDGLARGYLNRRELTQEKFIENPFSNSKSERLYKTGDLVRYLSDGNIEFIGRIDHQVKIRGFRIELGEIEAVLNTHPQIQQAVVIATQDIAANKRLVAYVVTSDQSLTTNQLREFLKEKLPEYMVPSIFVTLENLPLTPNGKVDRKALPAPDGEISRQHEYVAPRTAIEQTLTNIWQELLLKQKVSIHDNFFEIGGDSILSIQVVSRAKNSAIQITPKQIFLYQTIAELAKVANTTVSAEYKQGVVTGVAPLTPIQHWFFAQNTQELHHYNQSVLLQIPLDIKPQLLQKAVAKLLSHHDALRLRFSSQASEHKQINQGLDDTLPFSVVDLSSTPRGEQPQELSKIATEFQASLNLSNGPIIQVVMFNLGSELEARLLIIIHHLAVDGVSWRILLSDLETIYQQLIAQQAIELSAKTTAFIDWAEKLNNYAQSEIIKQELDYWLNQPWSQTTPLPLDYAHTQPENTVSSAAQVSVKLSVEETRALLGSVNEAYNTQINDILLSALGVSLAEWTDNSKVLIDLEGHGREELFSDVDLSRTVGWFTSLFPVLLQVPTINQPADIIKSIKEQLRAIPHRGIGYGILRYLCEVTTVNQQLQTIPTPEISFNYLGQFDQLQSQTGWKFAPESTGANQSSKQTRDHLLDINCLVVEGKLLIDWTYSSNVHARATVENLAQSYLKAIRSIIEHCQLEDAFGYTPSDFPDAQLNQLELDEFLELLGE